MTPAAERCQAYQRPGTLDERPCQSAGRHTVQVDGRRPEVAYLAHRDSYPGGRWRVTRFGPDLEPWGHDVAPTLADAIRAAAVDGADLETATPILATAVNPEAHHV